jgi:hypothetical protein
MSRTLNPLVMIRPLKTRPYLSSSINAKERNSSPQFSIYAARTFRYIRLLRISSRKTSVGKITYARLGPHDVTWLDRVIL